MRSCKGNGQKELLRAMRSMGYLVKWCQGSVKGNGANGLPGALVTRICHSSGHKEIPM